jgi:hypothetical protein
VRVLPAVNYTSTVKCLQTYADELDGILTRLEAVEEKFHPGLKEKVAKMDADFQKYAELMAQGRCVTTRCRKEKPN